MAQAASGKKLWPKIFVRPRLSVFASVRLAVGLLVTLAATILLGAWCPQISQGGAQKVSEMFGEATARQLIGLGVADIFHSPFFLALISLLTLNMIACSAQRVFPKVRSLKAPMVFLSPQEIARLPICLTVEERLNGDKVLESLAARLRGLGYCVRLQGDSLTAEAGKIGRLAPTVTHIGLLSLLLGVTITSWTGFSGFQPVVCGESLSFARSEHSQLWIGKLPDWRVRVDDTRREDYESGDVKQWYSSLSILDADGHVLKTQEISVNNPLSYAGVDIYQSSWGLDQLVLSFNGHKLSLPLQAMGKLHAAFLPLEGKMALIFSVRDQNQPVRIFAKIPEWNSPRLLSQLRRGQSVRLGSVEVGLEKLLPVTGLQYKSDPGLPITYIAFAFICLGVVLAAIPHRQVWAGLGAGVAGGRILAAGGVSRKAKGPFERKLAQVVDGLRRQQAPVPQGVNAPAGSASIVNVENPASEGMILKEEGNVRSSACVN